MELIPIPQETLTIGQLANTYAASNVFEDYQQRIADRGAGHEREVFAKKQAEQLRILEFGQERFHFRLCVAIAGLGRGGNALCQNGTRIFRTRLLGE